ncbi:hypothetical protein B7P43_G16455 [Cryptotermes secundus]|uniref:Uncharacterized protein n=1 Tax=Cryptotermes secundus TaxID=105785 RepID=A0A2J7QCZ3_9NEOP|nr:hypothetical protein B7P43_G16455 [Cryptotermes secundus]
MLASGKFSLTRSGTTANMETPTGSSVITNVDQQTVNSPERDETESTWYCSHYWHIVPAPDDR